MVRISDTEQYHEFSTLNFIESSLEVSQTGFFIPRKVQYTFVSSEQKKQLVFGCDNSLVLCYEGP